MLQALQGLKREYTFTVQVLDIDLDLNANDPLLAKYDELVPVLLGSRDDGVVVQLCYYHLDEAAVRAFLQ
jgi:hypothetical protein